jgi:hypothetical protein
MRALTLVLRQAQHEGELYQMVALILSLSKDEVARIIETISTAPK